ncbi:MAG: homogentisate 1,2-dioxygenase, partial [Gemmataceae bacterium]
MPYYRRMGTVPAKRHTVNRASPGHRGEGLYYEEVVTLAGFGRAHSVVYHLRPPTRARKVEPAGTLKIDTVEQPALRHHHLKSGAMPAAGDPVLGRVPLFTNADVTLSRCRPARPPQ